MPFGRDTRMFPSYTALDRGPGLPTGREDLGGGAEYPKFGLQIAAKPFQIAEWLLETAYRSSAAPYPMVLPPTSSPQITCSQRCRLVPNDFDRCFVLFTFGRET